MSIYLGENKVEMVGGTPIVVDGVDTSDANAAEEHILATKTAYVKGTKVTGKMTNNGNISMTMDGIDTKSVSIPSGYTSGGTVSLTNDIDNEVGDQADLISQIMTELEGKAAGGGGSGGLVMKTGTITLDATASSLVIDTGLSNVSTILITHETPSVSSTYGWSYSWDTTYGVCLYINKSTALGTCYGMRTVVSQCISKSSGTVTAKPYMSSYPIADGTFTWTAYGTE